MIGTELAFTPVTQFLSEPISDGRVLASSSDVADAFPQGDAPSQITAVDFAVDRVVFAESNPVVRFVVDDGAQLVLVAETLCQGAAPHTVAHIVHGTTRTSAIIDQCPYTGAECQAP